MKVNLIKEIEKIMSISKTFKLGSIIGKIIDNIRFNTFLAKSYP